MGRHLIRGYIQEYGAKNQAARMLVNLFSVALLPFFVDVSEMTASYIWILFQSKVALIECLLYGNLTSRPNDSNGLGLSDACLSRRPNRMNAPKGAGV